MEDNSLDTKTDFSELLNTLKTERRLLLLAQDNYRTLKTKFVKLSIDYSHLKGRIVKETENYQSRLDSHVDHINKSVQKLVDEIQYEKASRDEQFHAFKTRTLGELRLFYRDKFRLFEEEIHQLNTENSYLKKMNEKLENGTTLLQNQLIQQADETKLKEKKLKSEYDAHIFELRRELHEQSSLSNSKALVTQLEPVQSKIRILEERIFKSSNSHNDDFRNKDRECDELLRHNDVLNFEESVLEIRCQELIMENEKLKEVATNLQKEQIDYESLALSYEHEQDIELTDRCIELEARVNRLHDQVPVKDQSLKERQFQQCKDDETNILQALNRSQEEKEHTNRRIQELEPKILQMFSDQGNEIALIRLERDKLDAKLVEIMNTNDLSCHLSENEKLKEQIRLKDHKIMELKEHYRSLVSKMKHAYGSRENLPSTNTQSNL